MIVSSKKLALLCLALLATTMAVPAFAQGQGGGGGRGRGGFGGGGGFGNPAMQRVMLLNAEVVQKDLEISPEQKTELAAVAAALQAEMQTIFGGAGGGGGGDVSREDRRKQFEEGQAKLNEKLKEFEAKVNEILLPPQVDRLKQISLQQRGTSALSDPEVATALGLSDDQKAQLEKLREERRESFRGQRGPGGGGGQQATPEERQKRREEREAAQKAAEEKILAVLTAEQKTKFEELQGKKIELPQPGFGRGPGGGRGGRGPGGGGDTN